MINFKSIKKDNEIIGLELHFEEAFQYGSSHDVIILIQGDLGYEDLNVIPQNNQFLILYFNENIKKNINFNSETMLLYRFDGEVEGTEISGNESFVINFLDSDYSGSTESGNTSTDCDVEGIGDSIVEEIPVVDPITNEVAPIILATENSIKIVFDNDIDYLLESISVNSYKIHAYKDFPSFEFFEIENTINSNIVTSNFKFTSDCVNDVIVNYSYKNSFKTINKEFLFKPTFYLSSEYNLKKNLSSLGLKCDYFLDGENIKYLIWKYSQLAYESSGLDISDLPTLTDLELTLLSNYVCHKIIMNKFFGSIYGAFTGTDNLLNGENGSGIALADFSYTDGSYAPTTISELSRLLQQIMSDYTNQIQNMNNKRGVKSFSHNEELVNRTDIKLPFDKDKYIGKKSDKVRKPYLDKFKRGDY